MAEIRHKVLHAALRGQNVGSGRSWTLWAYKGHVNHARQLRTHPGFVTRTCTISARSH
eukprot:CAMPEP_0183344722 /NCGR_PEP_ID=MMETSP0164_2-20130417/10325_1 /TAXON_ID=221442 /ORGANISM="Coccolithus pelagicus ssp braarudi, Strain PLY182g" /LENGTH=57 /DNA_ID=CAMNT_0025515763 /DNA_START=110 /DNA_END=280 /DNA_ORIENTATION=+